MSSCKSPSRRSRYDWCTCAATQVRECGTGMEAKHKRPRHLFKFRWAQCMYRPIISTCLLWNASGTTLPGTEGSSGLESSGKVSSSLASSAFMAAILFCDSLGTPSWKHQDVYQMRPIIFHQCVQIKTVCLFPTSIHGKEVGSGFQRSTRVNPITHNLWKTMPLGPYFDIVNEFDVQEQKSDRIRSNSRFNS